MPESLAQRTGRHEGYSEFIYLCPEGYPTIGIGHRCNLGDYPDGIKYIDALKLLDEDLAKAQDACERKFPWLPDGIRKEVLIEMIFQLGIAGVLGFRKMLAALEKSDYEEAADQMLDSKWYKQTPKRCKELSELMRGQS